MSALYQPGHRVNFLCFPEVWSYVLSGLDRVQRPRGTKSKMNKHPEQNHRVGLPLRPGPRSTSRGARKAEHVWLCQVVAFGLQGRKHLLTKPS